MNFVPVGEVREILTLGGVKEFPACSYICTDCGQCVCCHKDSDHHRLDWEEPNILSSPDICPCDEVNRYGSWSHQVAAVLKEAGYIPSSKPHVFTVSALY